MTTRRAALMMPKRLLKTRQASSSRLVWKYSLNTGMNAALRAPPAIRKKMMSGIWKERT
jgi:hypothetical protein